MKINLNTIRYSCLLAVAAVASGCDVSTNVDGTCSSTFITEYNDIGTHASSLSAQVENVNDKVEEHNERLTSATRASYENAVVNAVVVADAAVAACSTFFANHKDKSCQGTLVSSSVEVTVLANDRQTICDAISEQRKELAERQEGL